MDEATPKSGVEGIARPSGGQREQNTNQGLRIDDIDAESLQEQRKYLMRGMLTLDAESTDLKADFETGRITESVYRQRMLDNRQLYRDLMEQLLKVMFKFCDYFSNMFTDFLEMKLHVYGFLSHNRVWAVSNRYRY
jgi:hypothetical protein